MCTNENDSNLSEKSFESKNMKNEMRESQEFDIWSELDKPFSEMNMERIADSIADEQASDFENEQGRQQMLKALSQDKAFLRELSQQKSRSSRSRRFASVAAIILIVFIGTGLTARAFFWEEILSLLAPITGLFPVSSQHHEGGAVSIERTEDEDSTIFNSPPPEEEEDYQNFESMHEALGDSCDWLLRLSEQYQFISGKIFSGYPFGDVNLNVTKDDYAFHIYKECFSQVSNDEDLIYDRLHEISNGEYDYVKYFGSNEVFFITNIDLSGAYWVKNLDCYQVFGKAPHEEIEKIILLITEEDEL